MLRKTTVFIFAILLGNLAGHAADEPGLSDLDKAVEVKLFARSRADWDQTVDLCERALRNGLGKEDAEFANKLASATLYEYAAMLSGPILNQERPPDGWQVLRGEAVRRLEKAVTFDERFGHAHYMLARLQAMPGGDRNKALDAANNSVRYAGDDNQQLSKALLLRANLRTEDVQRLADYNQAIIADPDNVEALRTRGMYHLSKGDTNQATADFEKVLNQDEGNVMAHHALAEVLTSEEKYDEALKHLDDAIKVDDKSPMTYTLRARIHVLRDNLKGAMSDLGEALKIDQNNIGALLMRSQLHQSQGDTASAKRDVERALVVQPNLVQGVLLRSMISASEGNFAAAIRDMEALVRAQPNNLGWQMQLASYFVGDKRPKHAIELYTAILRSEHNNAMVLRARGDALLSIGKQAEAIADYEAALETDPKDSGALNNLAWVLATSPEEKIRDGKRSIKVGLKACEETEYKAPHILSTLAAGYAEAGDFETAIKWSTKAVELGEGEMKKQLQEELESYKQKKPWREIQKVEEKPEPTRGGGDFEL